MSISAGKRKISGGAVFPFMGIVVLAAFFALATGGKFLSGNNIMNLLNQSYTVMLVAIGTTMIFAHGGIDFSVGAVLALSEMVAAMIYKSVGAAWILIPCTIIMATVCSLITGLITVKLNMPPFISSLCMQFACRGIVNAVLNTKTIGISSLTEPGWAVKLIVLVVIAAAVWAVLRFTLAGKYNKSIGENRLAAVTSGLDINSTRIIAYAISGAVLGMAAYFNLLRNGAMSSTVGVGLEMNVIVAVVLGGLSLNGGYRTSVRPAIIGSLIVVMMSNGFVMIGVPANYIGIIEGVVFLAVILGTYNNKSNSNGLLPR